MARTDLEDLVQLSMPLSQFRALTNAYQALPALSAKVQALENQLIGLRSLYHDKDLDDNGALKKPHYHIILRFRENRWRSALANELGIAENYLQKTGRFSASAQYLLHAGCEDKHLYDRSELIGPLADTVCNLLDRKDENARVVAMLDLLETCGYLSPSQASRLFAVNGYFFDFRRMGNLGLRILDEHNVRCSNGDHK